MKERFINMCEHSDLIVMGGIVIKYFGFTNALIYRVSGEQEYVYLDEIPDENFLYEDGFYIVKRDNCKFKFKFYYEISGLI